MLVFINGEQKDFSSEINLTELIQQLDITSKGLAIAINNAVVPKNDWEQTKLTEQDKITLIKATQGG